MQNKHSSGLSKAKITEAVLLAILAILILGFSKLNAQTFAGGNIAVFVTASSAANNTTAKLVELSTNTAAQAGIDHLIDGTAMPNSLRFSGSATSTGYLTNSNDRSLVCFAGGNTINTGSNINTITTRGIGAFNSTGAFNLATTYTGTSGNQTRSATSIDNASWFIGDQGGIYTNGTSVASPSGNIRSVKSFGGIVYTFSASASAAPVGTIAAPTGSTIVGLPGLANGATSRTDFYLVSSGTNGAAYDVLYVLDATSATVGTIFKYSLVSGSWVANGIYATTFGGFGLAAQTISGGAELFVSSGLGATAANNVIKLTDAAGYNATINITTGNNITLYTAAAGTTVKGIAFAPICVAPAQPAGFTTSSASVFAGQSNVIYTVPNNASVTYNWTYSGGTGVTITGSGNSVSLNFLQTATSGTLSVTASNACLTSSAQTIAITVSPSTDFAAGNLVVFKTSGTASKASSVITLKEYSTSGTPGISVSLPVSGVSPIQSAGIFGGSEGFLTTSSDQRFLVVGGYGTAAAISDITATSSSSTPRVVGRITPSGAYTQIASSTSFYNLNDIRGAVSDGTNFWAGGASNANVDGVDYFGPGTQVGLGTGSTPPKPYGLRIFNGQIYYSTQKAGPTNTASQLGIFSLGSGLPTSGTPTVSQVINTGSLIPQDFSFNAAGDVCYIAISLNTASGGIQKWTFNGSVWALAYTLGTGVSNIGAYGLVVDYSGANPILYATTFEAAGNRIIKIIDTGAGSAASNIVAATAGTWYKGVSFAPVDAITPVVDLSISTNAASEAGATVVIITASASSTLATSQTITVNVSGAGITAGDYNLSNTTITIPAGSSSGSVTFTVADDIAEEVLETATVFISNPSAEIALGMVIAQNIVIADNDNFVPTIVMDVATTTNYIDAGVVTSPASPFATSGVVGDVTDPSATSGIYFTIDDLGNNVNNLTVTASSNNTLVVPNANLVLTGTGASRKLTIVPIAVGYANITLTVSDGLNNAAYVINLAASDSIPQINPANTFQHTGLSDASDCLALDENYFITADDELDVINVYSLNASGLPVKSFDYTNLLNLPDMVKPEVDVEAVTKSPAVSNRVYFAGSMSNGKAPFDNKPNRDRLFATSITGTGATTSFSVTGYCDIKAPLLAWGDANGYGFSASAAAGIDSKAINGFASEGMVFGPDNTTLYIGLRAPLVPTASRTNAVIVPIVNFEAWFNNGAPAGSPTFGAPIELNLGGRGVRDIIKLSDGNYIIVAGNYGAAPMMGAIYKWSGHAGNAPVLVSLPGTVSALNMEGAMEVVQSSVPSSSKLHVLSDGGSSVLYNDAVEAKDFGNLNLRKFRSDILTGIDINLCTGAVASITSASNTTICTGDSVTLTANTGSSYLWSNNATTQSIVVHNAGNYSVAVTNANYCNVTSSATSVTVNSLPSAAITVGSATTFCAGDSVTLTANSASSYLWSTNETTQSIVVHNAGNYNVKLSDANSCSATSSNTSVTVNSLPSATITAAGATTFCAGDSVTLTVNSAASYLWSTNETTQSIIVHNAGNYNVAATDANACSATSSTTSVTVNALPSVSVSAGGTTTFCAGGNVVLTASPASSYLWSTNETAQSITVNSAGNYNVAVTDANACSATSSATSVTVNALPSALVSAGGATTFCAGGSVVLTASPASSYLWSTNETTQSITVSSAGNYNVAVTDANTCSATSANTSVTVNTLPTASVSAGSATTFCAGGSVVLTASPASSYLWSTNETTQSITVNSAGNYNVAVTDANACSATSANTSVTVNTLPTASVSAGSATIFCAGGSVVLTANPASSYLWSTNETTQSITVSSAGNYNVAVTDVNTCSATSSTTSVIVNALPSASITAGGATTFCAGGSVVLTASPASSYLWSTNETTQSITVLNGGSYNVAVSDVNSCSGVSSNTNVTVNALPTASFTSVVNVGTVDFTSNSIGATTYFWSFGDGNNSSLTGPSNTYLTNGTYTVCLTTTSSSGCMDSVCMPISIQSISLRNVQKNNSLLLYPNPVNNEAFLLIDVEKADKASIKVCDANGKVVKEFTKPLNVGKNSLLFETAELSSGVYTIQINMDAKIQTIKMIVVK